MNIAPLRKFANGGGSSEAIVILISPAIVSNIKLGGASEHGGRHVNWYKWALGNGYSALGSLGGFARRGGIGAKSKMAAIPT